MKSAPQLSELLVEHSAYVRAIVRERAGSLLRIETEEDLAQGANLHALERKDKFVWHSPEAFRGWLAQVVRHYVSDRRSYYEAARRNAGPLLRLTGLGSPLTRGVSGPATPRTGPVTFAQRRDEWSIAVKALATLVPRDQRILEWELSGRERHDYATDLGLSVEAAGRARLRALDRFRRAYGLMTGGPR